MSLRHSRAPAPPQSGFLTLQTAVRRHKRYITISNTSLTYGRRPDRIAWSVDLTHCRIHTTFKTLAITLPSGKQLCFRVSAPELQAWYPVVMTAALGVRQHYRVGACVGPFAGGRLFGASDREDGGDVRVWRVGKGIRQAAVLRARDRGVLRICGSVERAVSVVDVFEDCEWFHVVTEVFRGCPGRALGAAVKDVLEVLAALHEHGFAHSGVEEAVVVDARAWVMVYGYARPGGAEEMRADVQAVGRLFGKADRGCERVRALLRKGAPAKEVLADPWFCDDVGGGEGAEVDSPRCVLPSGNAVAGGQQTRS